jgi:hypothetical protein
VSYGSLAFAARSQADWQTNLDARVSSALLRDSLNLGVLTMSNTTTPTHEVPDIALITQFPLDYAAEAFVMLRRLTYMKLMMSETNPSQYLALEDVHTRQQVIETLTKIDPSASSCFTAMKPERDEYEVRQ